MIALTLLFSFSAVSSMSLNRIDTTEASQTQKGPEPVPQSSPSANSDVLHCHCNLPECITTSYMCKSQGLGCFSDLDANMVVERATHGCLDLLPRERASECGNVPGAHRSQTPSLLLCCHEDMCNHVDSPETRHKYNETIFAVAAVIGGSSEKMERAGYKEAWFRVATIAVPICGGLILLALIVLAVRILRSDSLDDAVLAAKLRRKHGFPVVMNGRGLVDTNTVEPGEKKHPLLFQQNPTTRPAPVLEKNLANAKLNTASLADYDKRSDPSSCNLYHGVSSPLLASGRPDKLDYKRALTPWPHHL